MRMGYVLLKNNIVEAHAGFCVFLVSGYLRTLRHHRRPMVQGITRNRNVGSAIPGMSVSTWKYTAPPDGRYITLRRIYVRPVSPPLPFSSFKAMSMWLSSLLYAHTYVLLSVSYYTYIQHNTCAKFLFFQRASCASAIGRSVPFESSFTRQ